jgi:hypothetical protein
VRFNGPREGKLMAMSYSRLSLCLSLYSLLPTDLAGMSERETRCAPACGRGASSSRLGAIPKFKLATPVMLPPGRFRLATRPSLD